MDSLTIFRRALRAVLFVGVLAAPIFPSLYPEPVGGQVAGGRQGGSEPLLAHGVPLPAALPQPRIEIPVFPGGEKSLPTGWSAKEFVGKADISLERMGPLFAVTLISNRSSFAIHREVSVDIDEYPHLSWAWRVDRLPVNGNARRSALDDQAAQLYVVFPGFPLPYQIVGYIWDSTAPPGSVFRSAKNPLVRLVVLRSGPDRLGEWVWESRNVFEDFRRLFMEDPTEVMAIALLINSQNTQSSAQSRFASLLFSRNPITAPPGATATAPSRSTR